LQGIVGITGTPGTGKKSVSPIVAKLLGLPCLGLNDFASAEGLYEKGGEVDTRLLKSALSKKLKTAALVYGHLLPYSIDRSEVARVAVLRCEPSVLKQRLVSRGYVAEKVAENVEAELIGSVSADSIKAFGTAKVAEVDATYTSPSEAARQVVALANDRRMRTHPIDWMTNYDSGAKLRSLLPST
jgi:adenylate kinase